MFCIKGKAMSNNATSNETDLDWLARNVHVWGPNELLRMKSCDNGNGTFRASWCYSGDGGFTKDQWLARRAELQNKPSWKGAPEWATHLAQASVGNWFFFSGEPYPRETAWRILESMQAISLNWKGEVLGDWRDTLEKRPEQAEFGPFVSVEDAKLTIMQSDGDVKHFGGIIGRSLPLEEDAATAKNCDQVVTINIKPDSTLIHQPRGRIKRITTSKYTKTIHGVSVDVYDVLQAWGVSNPALQHLIKKALQCGHRGHKDNAQDLQDIIDSAIRAKELES